MNLQNVQGAPQLSTKPTRWFATRRLNRCDGFVLVLSWLTFVTFCSVLPWLFPYVDQVAVETGQEVVLQVPAVMTFNAGFLALGCALGWGRFSRRRVMFLTFFMILCATIYYVGNGFQSTSMYGADSLVREGLSNALLAASSLLGVLFCCAVLTFCSRKIFKVRRWLAERLNLSRKRLLVGSALILFAMATAQNIFAPDGSWGGPVIDGGTTFLVLTVGFFGLVFLPSWAVFHCRRRWCVCLAFVPVTLCVGYYVWQFCAIFWLGWVVIVSATAVLTFFFYLVIWLSAEKHEAISWVPSRWSLIPMFASMALLVSFFVAIQLLSAHSLTDYMFGKFSFARASMNTSIFRESVGRINLVGEPGDCNLFCEFDANTRPDVLSCLPPWTIVLNEIEIDGLNPDISIERLRSTSPFSVFIRNSTINASQLDLILNEFTEIKFDNVCFDWKQFDASGNRPFSKVVLSNIGSGQLAKFADAVASANVEQIEIWDTVKEDDVQSLLKLSRKIHVVVKGIAPIKGELPKLTSDMNFICSNRSVSWLRMAMDSEFHCVKIGFNDFVDEYNQFVEPAFDKNFDLVFAKHGEAMIEDYGFLIMEIVRRYGIEKATKRLSLAYGQNPGNEITEVLLPGCESLEELQGLSELKTLSFDGSWLFADGYHDPRFDSMKVDLDMESHQQLERLYFDPNRKFAGVNSYSGDISLFGKLPKLKHLQISDAPRGKLLTGFDWLKRLESLTMFGLPNQQAVAEIAKLKKLKKVTFVLPDAKSAYIQSWIGATRNKLPQVQVNLIDRNDWKPDIPASFREHLEHEKAKARKKLLGEFANDFK